MTSSLIYESYVPVYDVVPDKWEDARPFLVEMLKKITNSLNVKEIGFYLDQELLNGGAFIPGVNNTQEFRSIFRKVIDFGALPAAGIKSVAHGINVDANFTLLHMYAAATDPVSLISFPIPYDPAGSVSGVGIYMDSTNVNIAVESNRSSFTRCFVTIEYIQEL